MLVGLMGDAGAGKDTVADHLAYQYGFHKHAFAERLYREVSEAFDVGVALLGSQQIKNYIHDAFRLSRCRHEAFVHWLLPQPNAPMAETRLSPRYVLQRWDDYRREQDAEYFIRPIRRLIDDNPDGDHVISDLKKWGEYNLLDARGAYFWRIVGDWRTHTDNNGHSTETELEWAPVDHVVFNTSTIEQLYALLDFQMDNQLAEAI